MGGMGTSMMPGMGMGMMPMMGMGGIDVASQIKTAMLEKEVADMRREQQNAKIEALSRGRSLDSFSDTSSLRDDAASSLGRSAFSSTGMSVISDGMSTTASLDTMVDTSGDEFKVPESDDSIILGSELSTAPRFGVGSVSKQRKKEASDAYKSFLSNNYQLLFEAIKAISSNNEVSIVQFTKELIKEFFKNEDILITWQTTPKKDAFFEKVFSRQGLLISTDTLVSNMSPKSLKAIKKLYEEILETKERINIPAAAVSHIKILIKTIDAKLKESGDPETVEDDTSSDSEEVETDKKVASLIRFFTNTSAHLTDPELAGNFARQALKMMSQSWFAKRWKNITSFGRSNTGLIKKRDALHSAVFSKQGLLKTKDAFNELNNKITSEDLAAVRELYVYIEKNPSLVGISDEPDVQGEIKAILTWLSKISPNDGSQTFDPYVVDSIPPEETDAPDEDSGSPDSYTAPSIQPRAFTGYRREEER